MATENPRVAAYPPPLVYERLLEFKRSQGLKSDSAAIVAILEAYLFGSPLSVLVSEPSVTPKRIEDLEVKVSSLLSDVAVLKQAISQYTRPSSSEHKVHDKELHSSDNYESLSEPPNKSSNTTLDFLTKESVSTYTNTSISESPLTGADGDTQLVKSSVRETALTNSEPDSESLVGEPIDGPGSYPLAQENISATSELLGELRKSTPDLMETALVLEKELPDTHVAIDESLTSVNQLVAPETSTCEAKEFSVEFSLGGQWSEPTRVDIIQNSEGTKNISSELPESGSLESITSEPLDSSLAGRSLVEENNYPKVPSVNSEPLNAVPSSSLTSDESKNSLKVPLHLTGAALARRLNVSPSTIRHKKNSRNFGQWTLGHDPDGIAWYFDGQKFIEKT